MELDVQQKKIVESKESKILVIAGSGSGKTRVLTERIKYLLDNGVDPKKLVAITFTNAAADEMRERLGESVKDAFIGTIHSYANKLLLLGGITTKKYIEEEDFDEFFVEIKNNPSVIQEVDHLLVDEFQDIDDHQYEFLINMISSKNFFLVGDDWQNIYSWRGSNVKHFLRLAASPAVATYEMSNNYRTARTIVSFAMGFLRPVVEKIPKTISCKNEQRGTLVELPEPDLNYIIEEIKKYGVYRDWFILCRKNSEIDEITRKLKKNFIPFDTFKKSDLSNTELKRKMKENTVKVLTVHSAKGLENENVAVIGVRPSSDEERRVAYVAATRAKNHLIWCYNMRPKKKNYYRNTSNWE